MPKWCMRTHFHVSFMTQQIITTATPSLMTVVLFACWLVGWHPSPTHLEFVRHTKRNSTASSTLSIYAAVTGCSKSRRKAHDNLKKGSSTHACARFSKSRRKARDNLKKGSTKHALLVSSTYLVLSVLFRNNPITNRRNPGSDLSNKFVKNLLGLKRQYSGGDACLCPFWELKSRFEWELKSRFEFALKSASDSRANSPSEGGLSLVVLTEDDALAWQRQEKLVALVMHPPLDRG